MVGSRDACWLLPERWIREPKTNTHHAWHACGFALSIFNDFGEHASRFTHHASRITLHASRFTHHAYVESWLDPVSYCCVQQFVLSAKHTVLVIRNSAMSLRQWCLNAEPSYPTLFRCRDSIGTVQDDNDTSGLQHVVAVGPHSCTLHQITLYMPSILIPGWRL